MTAIEDIRYLQDQGRLVLDMNTRAILELYEALEKVYYYCEDLDETLKIIKDRLDLQADSNEPVQVPETEEHPSI